MSTVKSTIADDTAHIDGDVAPSFENSYSGSLHVSGTVRKGAALTARTINISQDVEEAELIAAGSIYVGGVIRGKGKRGRCVAAAALGCHAVENATIVSGGDITVAENVTNAQICCGGAVAVKAGAINGGTVSANAGIVCATAGNVNGNPTRLAPGTDLNFQLLFAEQSRQIESERDKLMTLRSQLAPMLANLKQLSPQSKEYATEMLCEIDVNQRKLQDAVARLKKAFENSIASTKSELQVLGTLHAGVIIRFPGMCAKIATSIDGPLIVKPVHRDDKPKLLVKHGDRGSSTFIDAIALGGDANAPYLRFFEGFDAPASTVAA